MVVCPQSLWNHTAVAAMDKQVMIDMGRMQTDEDDPEHQIFARNYRIVVFRTQASPTDVSPGTLFFIPIDVPLPPGLAGLRGYYNDNTATGQAEDWLRAHAAHVFDVDASVTGTNDTGKAFVPPPKPVKGE